MEINGIVPNLPVASADIDRAFYAEFLGLRSRFEQGDVTGFASATKPAAQVHLMAGATGQEPDFRSFPCRSPASKMPTPRPGDAVTRSRIR